MRRVCRSKLDAESGRTFLQPKSHNAFDLLHSVCPVLKVQEGQSVPGHFNCVGKEEASYSIFKERSLSTGGSGKTCGRGIKLRHKDVN